MWNTWRRIIALMKKEFLTLLQDKKSRFVIIGPPLVQLLVFGYAATFDLNHVPFAVYNEDGGSASRELVARFEGSPNFQLVRQVRNEAEIAPIIDNKEALLLIHIGPQFSRHLSLGEPAPLQVIVDGRDSNTALIALGYLRTIVIDEQNQRRILYKI